MPCVISGLYCCRHYTNTCKHKVHAQKNLNLRTEGEKKGKIRYHRNEKHLPADGHALKHPFFASISCKIVPILSDVFPQSHWQQVCIQRPACAHSFVHPHAGFPWQTSPGSHSRQQQSTPDSSQSWIRPTQLCALAKACWKANTHFCFVFWSLNKAVISASLNTQVGPELRPASLQQQRTWKHRIDKTG